MKLKNIGLMLVGLCMAVSCFGDRTTEDNLLAKVIELQNKVSVLTEQHEQDVEKIAQLIDDQEALMNLYETSNHLFKEYRRMLEDCRAQQGCSMGTKNADYEILRKERGNGPNSN